MSELIAEKTDRLVSLDVVRGITIAGMILVNHPGSWGNKYGMLGHAQWNGWTPTDLVFPFFLFIVGVAMTLSFDRRLAKGHSRVRLFEHVVRRSLMLFLLGLIMYGFPNWRLIWPFILFIIGLSFLFMKEPPFSWGETPKQASMSAFAWVMLIGSIMFFTIDFRYFQETHLRVPGVLQRIAVCYLFTSIIMLKCGLRGRFFWTSFLIIGYWAIIKCVHAPAGVELPAEYGYRSAHLLNEWIYVKLLGSHLYSERPDPEGILSTMPAIATTLIGVLTGSWLRSSSDKKRILAGLIISGTIAVIIGKIMDIWFPINKKIWSSSYVVFTGGLALYLLALCYWLIDMMKFKKWSVPFLVFGTNAILVYFCAHVCSKLLGRWKFALADGTTASMYSWIYNNLFLSWASYFWGTETATGAKNASVTFAITYVLIWLLILIPFYRRKIFLKI
jgi:predicted acyltransferase